MRKRIIGAGVLTFLLVCVLGYGLLIAVPSAPGGNIPPCCRNGYKAWKDPGISGNYNIRDCWCDSHEGRDMIQCSCSSQSSSN